MNDEEFDQILAKYRDETLTSLPFEPGIDRLLESDYCKRIDEIVHASGQKWERQKAVPSLGESLPNRRGLYMFVWKPELRFRFGNPPFVEQCLWILYIGKAGIEGGEHDTIRHRYKTEYGQYVGRDPSTLWDPNAATTRAQRLARYLTLRPLEYWFLLLDDPRDINMIERRLIRLLNPPVNRQHGPKLRAGQPQPAFEEPT